MKLTVRVFTYTALLLCISFWGHSQVLKSIGNRVKQKATQRADAKVDQTIDKGIDKTVDATKTNKTTDTTKQNKQAEPNNENRSATQIANSASNSTEPISFKTYSKYDFIPGDKVIAYDEFAKDEIGDFPAAWNTNSSGEVVTVASQSGRWLMMTKKGRFIPEYIKDLPDNFTFEFDVITNENFSFYSPSLDVFFLTGNNSKAVFDYSFIPLEKRSGVKIGVHPTNASNNGGGVRIESFEDGTSVIKNEVNTIQFNSHGGKTKLHVSVWRQKQRVRVYLNEEKVFDLPRAFVANKTYSTLLFDVWADMNNDKDRYVISNLKLSAGAPDTRNKLMTEGKFVTHGILFDVNSDKIRPESYGTLKDIANVLNENSSVRVKIIGHTDADGDDKSNMDLSKRRAEAVKNILIKEFSIDASRLEPDGKGESQPVDSNTTPEGKANNRRVEFVKL